MQLYLKAGFSLPVQASFLICTGDSVGTGYHQRAMPLLTIQHAHFWSPWWLWCEVSKNLFCILRPLNIVNRQWSTALTKNSLSYKFWSAIGLMFTSGAKKKCITIADQISRAESIIIHSNKDALESHMSFFRPKLHMSFLRPQLFNKYCTIKVNA